MTTSRSLDEIAEIAERIYRERIRPIVMPQHKGEFLALDIDSGEYEVDKDDLAASDRLRAKRPNGTYFGFKVGYQEAESLGGRMAEDLRSAGLSMTFSRRRFQYRS